ncbi:glyoxalase family protein [Mycolicibacterium mageritense DSM 44476 = CIP 104973]|uniref:Glyoxalase n=1 Tax=Mycolicibacterium mageritense TaxID=53462 RepID=A0ABM7HX81_MYCME|nr:VOC family protein [Mycolicibacterium mageritense]MCC9183276.1 VOC family protein [Mycolicibacterium mageritense]BBX35212.1 glyoxalase [Mycolicibacterium mageritense]CDO20277.1 putative enzyme related to lactoylglutathione lyase [Mycolicibacterium mageritense DSM 44476 = CIP 104973]
MSGRVVHFEVPFSDGARAKDFYREVFGWQLNDYPEMNYTGVATGPVTETGMPAEPGYIGGGMFERAENYPQGPVITIDVPSIDEALTAILSKGGAQLGEKIPVGEMGFAAYFTDTEGNILGLWETAAPA